MALDQTRRLKPDLIEADRRGLAALQAIPDYHPANSQYALEALTAAQAAMDAARAAETQALAAAAAARDSATAAEWTLHNAMLAAKDQVVAQYGADSDQVQSIGLKKKSERKRRSSKTAASG